MPASLAAAGRNEKRTEKRAVGLSPVGQAVFNLTLLSVTLVGGGKLEPNLLLAPKHKEKMSDDSRERLKEVS
jgi:hypothetical protein